MGRTSTAGGAGTVWALTTRTGGGNVIGALILGFVARKAGGGRPARPA